MERHLRRHKRTLAGQSGQSTVEFAVVTAAFIGLLAAGSLLWKTVSGGLFVEHALMSASHHVKGVLGWVVDIFSY